MDYSRINGASVAWAFESASNLLRDELERMRSLNDKAAHLAGFAGVALAISGSIGRDGFGSSRGGVGEVAFAAFYFGAMAALAATMLWLVLLRNYLTDDRLLQAEPWALQIRTLRMIYPAARWAAAGAAQMEHRIRVGAGLFATGLTLFLGAAVTLGLGSL